MGAAEFWARARSDIAAAKRRVLVQAMSFEGDAAGLAVAAALRDSGASDRRVLVDGYTRVNVNDRSIITSRARRDEALQSEVRATDAMFRGLERLNIAVRVTNPVARLGLNYPARNHKKLLVADDVAYIGGVNFSDHNFEWPDLMLRIDGSDTASFLAADFDRTYHGITRRECKTFGPLRLLTLDGRTNRTGFAPIMELIAKARVEIVVVSPYLTFPFTDAMAKAAKRGVAVRLLTPWDNNKPIVRDALLWSARRNGFDVRLGPVMSHLKGLLVDGDVLVLGSSNFDFASLAAEEEFLAIVRDEAIISAFRKRVVGPLSEAAVEGGESSRLRGWTALWGLRAAALVAASARNSRRTAVDWSS